MPIEGFDYKEFATAMSEQAKELVPADLNDMQKNYVVKTLANFTMLAGEAISKDESLGFNAEQAIFVSQVIAEWAFHKSIDLIHSGILPENWDSIMQKIAFSIFEVAKQGIKKNIPQDQLLQLVEHHVVKTYTAAIDDLLQKGKINEEIKERAVRQSNIDAMAQQVQEEQQKQEQQIQQQQATQGIQVPATPASSLPQNQAASSSRIIRLATVAIILKKMPESKVRTILSSFSERDAQTIIDYMATDDLEETMDKTLTFKCLREMKKHLPKHRKRTSAMVLKDLNEVFETKDRNEIDKSIKDERPYIRKFIDQAYEGEFYNLPVKVAGIIAQHVRDSV
ncbi:hypothetical protein IJI31_01715 [bacterium]|nr:hypothetical protein [bacterium]